MIRATRLAPSRPMYAFDPTTWRPASYGGFEVDAVWFKRKAGRLVAVMGTYHPMVLGHGADPTDGRYESWIGAADDNRYGGNHLSSWDGEALLTTDPPRITPEEAAERTAFLARVLAAHPNPPAGYDGWWTFPRQRPR